MSVSGDFLDRLRSGAAMTCLCWRLERTDGVVVAATEHDKPLVVNGITYQPGAALSGALFKTGFDMAPGHASASGAISSEAISEADLAAGLWNGATIAVIRADWMMPEHWVHVWSGRFSDITHGPTGFQAELVSQKAQLERLVGRQYTRRCDAVLGDARCGLDLADLNLPQATCDQTLTTCQAVFQNAENFRGFPHMPGADFVIAGPAANAGDGGAS